MNVLHVKDIPWPVPSKICDDFMQNLLRERKIEYSSDSGTYVNEIPYPKYCDCCDTLYEKNDCEGVYH